MRIFVLSVMLGLLCPGESSERCGGELHDCVAWLRGRAILEVCTPNEKAGWRLLFVPAGQMPKNRLPVWRIDPDGVDAGAAPD